MDQRQSDHEPSTYFPFGFPLSREVWKRYELVSLVGSETVGDVRTDIHVIRKLVQRINLDREGHDADGPPITAGQVLTLGLISEILRFIINYYCWEQAPGALRSGLERTRREHDESVVTKAPPAFVHLFPPQLVMLQNEDEKSFLVGVEHGRANHDVAIREMILLWLAVPNPALRSFRCLFSDAELATRTPYKPLMKALDTFFASEPPVEGFDETLFECLRAPMRAAPDSLEGQLEFIRTRWAHLLPKSLLNRLLLVRGILREETLQRGFVQGAAEVLRFGRHSGTDLDGYPEPERFSRDADWMSNVVLMAKTVYVWLDQLSKRYQRDIHRLDQIPDEELDRLARWGFNGLWLIGLWERSPASEDIKRTMGNPEAVSSAYSLYDYDIAQDLGGETAYQNLRERARARGIRLASDMVPNHVGIYSRWVVEHPQWFLSSDYPPFPSYSFTGKNLSRDDRVGIYIEDGYWSHRDAAVVCKRVDHWTGDTKYIYHGNDGTSMPWNDTAQLDYLQPEVREAVIQTILHVARKFSIIRFDAAMTLAKKHYQRLWFPKPGEAGAIPSRAEYGMTRAEFDRRMPEEFWREVVDRVAQEVPDTLLLAEAFWLMEGYFVRTLGMHRVYNSAFMNMLKMEYNADYRTTVKNVLEFSPEILKRFVNFMNNPDERTAADQFGKGDKYFGVALLMVTMPGLPMFGHGQIEGFTEKYGMEYRRAYWDEPVDEEMIRRHEREIFPLMRRRYLFSGVEHFAFYDFHTPQGHVDENVFAYSNRVDDERAVIFYNNAYNTTEGWIRVSTALNSGRGDEGTLVHKTLADSLALRGEDHIFYTFRDHRDGLQYIRTGRQLCAEGMFVRLYAYQYHLFLDFREAVDRDGSWAEIARRLNGAGTPDIWLEHRKLELAPLLASCRGYVNRDHVHLAVVPPAHKPLPKSAWHPVASALGPMLAELGEQTGCPFNRDELAQRALKNMNGIRLFEKRLAAVNATSESQTFLLGPVPEEAPAASHFWRMPAAWALLQPIEHAMRACPSARSHGAWLDEWLIGMETLRVFEDLGGAEWSARQDLHVLRILLAFDAGGPDMAIRFPIAEVLADPIVREYLMVNRYEGVLYLNREQFERLLYWLCLVAAVEILGDSSLKPGERSKWIERELQWNRCVLAEAESGGYRIDALAEWALKKTMVGDGSPAKTKV